MRQLHRRIRFAVAGVLGAIGVLLTVCASAQRSPALIPYQAAAALWGYCDSLGAMRIPPQFRTAGLFYKGGAIVSLPADLPNVFCVIDTLGRYRIPPAYHWDGYLSRNMQYAALNAHDSTGKWGITDGSGRLLLPFRYTPAYRRGGGDLPHTSYFERRDGWPVWFMVAGRDGRQGVLDTTGRERIPFQYDEIVRPGLSDSLRGWVVRRGDAWDVLRIDGRELFPVRFRSIEPLYRNGWARVRVQGGMGIIDTAGRWIVPPQYDSVRCNSNDTNSGFHVQRGDRWGWLDRTGRLVVPVAYECCINVRNGYLLAPVEKNGRYLFALYSSQGALLLPPRYTSVVPYRDSIVVSTAGAANGYWHATTRVLNARTLRPAGKPRRRRIRLVPGDAERRQGTTDSWHPADPADPPHLDSAGTALYRFVQDGLVWAVTGYVQDGKPDRNGFKERPPVTAAAYDPVGYRMVYAVLDQRRRYIVRPQDRYAFKGGSMPGNWLVAYRDSAYVLTDTALHELTKPTPFVPFDAFFWRGRPYLFVHPGSGKAHPVPNDFGPGCTTVLDGDGGIVRSIEALCYQRLYDDGGAHPACPPTDRLVVWDSLERVGVVHLDGRVAFPGISFRYKRFDALSPDLFFASNEAQWGDGVLVDAKGQECIPGLKVHSIRAVQAYSALTGYTYVPEPGLLQLEYRRADNQLDHCYMSASGVVYADENALK